MKRYKIGDAELDAIEQKVMADIREHGWHVVGVMPTADTQEFAYSIGVYKSYGQPELAIFGVPFQYAHAIINDLVIAAKRGERFEPGREYPDLLEGARCIFVPANHGWYEACFGRAIDFYGTLDFPVLQCVWSDPAGHYPWEYDFDPRLTGLQPNLTADPGNVVERGGLDA
jgi:hypothetical protein